MRQSDPDGQHIRNSLLIVTPVYDDWESFGHLLRDIEIALPAEQYDVEIIAVDDCSNAQPVVPALAGSIASVTVLRLRMNVGHQRAIAVGLVHADSEPGHQDSFMVVRTEVTMSSTCGTEAVSSCGA